MFFFITFLKCFTTLFFFITSGVPQQKVQMIIYGFTMIYISNPSGPGPSRPQLGCPDAQGRLLGVGGGLRVAGAEAVAPAAAVVRRGLCDARAAE